MPEVVLMQFNNISESLVMNPNQKVVGPTSAFFAIFFLNSKSRTYLDKLSISGIYFQSISQNSKKIFKIHFSNNFFCRSMLIYDTLYMCTLTFDLKNMCSFIKKSCPLGMYVNSVF